MKASENELLTRFGTGTPMGNLLRRYWHPIAGSSEVTVSRTRPIRLLGENLVLFRDKRGQPGLIADRCPHRGAQMRYGIPEEEGLRCAYHGRLFSATGACLETPSDRGTTGSGWKTRIQAYPVEELGGLVFAYLGPEPRPLLPRWEFLVRNGFVKQIGYMRVKCNWLQVAENAVDLEHLYWLHAYYATFALDRMGAPADDPRRAQPEFFSAFRDYEYRFEAYERGIMRWYIKRGAEEDSGDASLKLPVIFPNLAVVQAQDEYTMNYRVPIDDTETLYISYMCFCPPGVPIPEQREIPCYEVPVTAPDGECLTDFQNGQDAMVWVTQGVIADREHETLGREDKGVVLFRRMLHEQLARIEVGKDPMNVFRDPADDSCFAFNLDPQQSQVGRRTTYMAGTASGPYLPSHSPIQSQIDSLFVQALRNARDRT